MLITPFSVFIGKDQTLETKKKFGGKCWSASYMTHWWKTNKNRNGVPNGGNLEALAYRSFLKENNLEEKIAAKLLEIYHWLDQNPDYKYSSDIVDPGTSMANEIKSWIRAGVLSSNLIQEMNSFFISCFLDFVQEKICDYQELTGDSISVANFKSITTNYVMSAFIKPEAQQKDLAFDYVSRISNGSAGLYDFLLPRVNDFTIMIRSSFTKLEDQDNDEANAGDSMGAGLFDSLPAKIWNWQIVLLDFWAEVFDLARAISSTIRFWKKDGSMPLLKGDMPACMMVKDRTEKGYSAVAYCGLRGVVQVTINSGFDSVVKGDDVNVINYLISTSRLQDGTIYVSAIRSRDSNRKFNCFATLVEQLNEILLIAQITYEQSVDVNMPVDTEFGNPQPGKINKISQYQLRRWDRGYIPSSINDYKLLAEPTSESIAMGFTNAPFISSGTIYKVESANDLPGNMSGKIILAPNAGTDYRKITASWGTPNAPSGFLAETGSTTAHVPAVLAGVMMCGVSVNGKNLKHGDFVTGVCSGGKINIYKEDIPFEPIAIHFDEIPKTKLKTGLVLPNLGWCDIDSYLPDVSKVSLCRWEMTESGLVINQHPVLPMPCYIYYSLMPQQIKEIIDIQRSGQDPVEFYTLVICEVLGGLLDSFKGRPVNLRLPDWRVPVEADFYLPNSIFKNPDNPDAALSGARLITQGGELGQKILGVVGDVFTELKHRGFTNFCPMLPNVCYAELDALPIINNLNLRGITPQEFDYVCMDEVPELSGTNIDGDPVEYLKLKDAGVNELSEGNNDQTTAQTKIARDQTADYHLFLASHPNTKGRYYRKVQNANRAGLILGSCGNAHPALLKTFQEVGFDSVGLPPGIAYVEAKRLIAENENQLSLQTQQ